jgi:hypothetical protein
MTKHGCKGTLLSTEVDRIVPFLKMFPTQIKVYILTVSRQKAGPTTLHCPPPIRSFFTPRTPSYAKIICLTSSHAQHSSNNHHSTPSACTAEAFPLHQTEIVHAIPPRTGFRVGQVPSCDATHQTSQSSLELQITNAVFGWTGKLNGRASKLWPMAGLWRSGRGVY